MQSAVFRSNFAGLKLGLSKLTIEYIFKTKQLYCLSDWKNRPRVHQHIRTLICISITNTRDLFVEIETRGYRFMNIVILLYVQ